MYYSTSRKIHNMLPSESLWHMSSVVESWLNYWLIVSQSINKLRLNSLDICQRHLLAYLPKNRHLSHSKELHVSLLVIIWDSLILTLVFMIWCWLGCRSALYSENMEFSGIMQLVPLVLLPFTSQVNVSNCEGTISSLQYLKVYLIRFFGIIGFQHWLTHLITAKLHQFKFLTSLNAFPQYFTVHVLPWWYGPTQKIKRTYLYRLNLHVSALWSLWCYRG